MTGAQQMSRAPGPVRIDVGGREQRAATGHPKRTAVVLTVPADGRRRVWVGSVERAELLGELVDGRWRNGHQRKVALIALDGTNGELAEHLRGSYPDAVVPGYHLNKRHWNTVLCAGGSVTDAMVRDIVEDSYDLIVAAMPRAVRERLGWTVSPAP